MMRPKSKDLKLCLLQEDQENSVQEDSVQGVYMTGNRRILFLEVSDEEVSIMRNMMTLFPEVFMTRNRRICTGGVHDEK